ncbi:ribosome assembly cofactor RimP [Flavobacterium salilacus subsp. salilacus]|uniref:ribosome assembly cofactor RimP n=1 Tax=Flavobacterium TaxID=237 RepID=UPI001075859E|nr:MULTISPECIES: ribosome assembly cofactor RimP [Flavobacterium]KAF2520022.1 ribosome assembly cofactor RimP [Flavobacterium salilacus subsp. salilacus]MBE1614062.1 ribosome assembly cofactor RimP [Flavobacterium sp. SaA2.13]NDI97851.1 ribosome assembly cofactor RimP [Flavobacterium salilacus subsp. altitudinum]
MTFKEKVSTLLEAALEERPSLFLIDLKITDSNKIMVTLDGDKGVNLQDCIDISRAIEHNLDREEHDFSLEVTSAGATTPLTNKRQYAKNVGRTLKIVTENQDLEATLTETNDEFIVLEWKAREPKQIGKGKETVQKRAEIPYNDIKEAVVVIKF